MRGGGGCYQPGVYVPLKALFLVFICNFLFTYMYFTLSGRIVAEISLNGINTENIR